MKLLAIIFLLALFIPSLKAQDDWKLSGHVQLRTEVDGRDFSNETHPLIFTSLRTRVGLEKTFADKVNFFVQIQDSRIFGEEPNTLTPIDNVDLHQGYITLLKPLDIPVDIQAGRFEVAYGTERFFGSVGWHFVGRSWDGVRLKCKTNFNLDLFALTHSSSTGYIANATPGTYPFPAESEPSHSVYGVWSTFNPDAFNRVDLFGYYNITRNINGDPQDDISQFTLGGNHIGTYGAFSTIAEAAYQFGDDADANISSYLLSLQGFYSTGCLKLGLGADILSGTEDGSDDVNSFSVDFGTNHKFYGFMDYFINIPGNTQGLGLNDFYISSLISGKDNPLSGSIHLHHFNSNQPSTIDESTFGQEIDLILKYDLVAGTAITWGGSLFFPGELMKTFFNTSEGPREDTSFWTYLMITATL